MHYHTYIRLAGYCTVFILDLKATSAQSDSNKFSFRKYIRYLWRTNSLLRILYYKTNIKLNPVQICTRVFYIKMYLLYFVNMLVKRFCLIVTLIYFNVIEHLQFLFC